MFAGPVATAFAGIEDHRLILAHGAGLYEVNPLVYNPAMDSLGFVLLGGLAVIGVLLYLVYQKLSQLSSSDQLDEEKTKNIVNQVFGEVANKVVAQTKQVLSSDKEAIFKDNENKRQVLEKLVGDLKKEIDERQDEIRGLEKDRNKKFGEITTAISEHRKLTEELKTSTETLARVLSNNQTRGQWGERIIEDILQNAGLIENVHYARQQALGTSSVKPDITLLLPNKRVVAIDVKFPYAEVQKMASAEKKTEKAVHMKAFERDLKDKIKQIETRGYIDVEHGTLDYAIMFVPNEMLFSFINQQFPEIVDEAMGKKVMIVSPFTFLIVARTVFESYRNFMIENNLRKIVKHINQFVEEWGRFRGEFDKFDEVIGKLRKQYDTIRGTRYNRMEMRLKRIEEDQKGAELESREQKLLE